MRKLINNFYVKNNPKSWTKTEAYQLFSPFGNIKFLVLQEHENLINLVLYIMIMKK